MSNRIGVIGASGFVGRALVADMVAREGYDLRLFGRSAGVVEGLPVAPLTGDPAQFAGLDRVIHLAAQTNPRAPQAELRAANVDLAVAVAEASAAAGVRRFVFLSSLHVHGRSATGFVGPASPPTPDNPYGRSKADAEQALRAIEARTGMQIVIVRPPLIYGPGAGGNFRLLARLVGRGAPLPFGLARSPRSFCSMANLLSAIRHVVDSPSATGVIAPADPQDLTTRELVSAMGQAQGRPVRLFPVPRQLLTLALTPIGRQDMVASLFEPLRIDRAHWSAFGWTPPQATADALAEALGPGSDGAPLVLYVTNSTPFFFSHRIDLARAAARAGYRVALAGPDVEAHRDALAVEGIAPITIATIARGVSPVGDLKASRALAQAIRRMRPAVVHAVGLKIIFLMSLVMRQTRLPRTVCIFTGLGALYVRQDARTRRARRIVEAFLRPLLRAPETRVIFQNGDDRAYFIGRGLAQEETSRLIRGSGVDPARYPRIEEPDGPPLVVFPARLLVSKGVRDFVDAASRLKACGVQARFALVGDLDPGNPDSLTEAELKAAADAGQVEVWGFRQDMVEVLGQSHIVCLPSYYPEGVPKCLIEAASVGRAIVTCDSPGCREIVQHGVNGLLVPVRDPTALAEALDTLIRDAPVRRAMGAEGRRRVETEFAAEHVIARTLAVYEETLG